MGLLNRIFGKPATPETGAKSFNIQASPPTNWFQQGMASPFRAPGSGPVVEACVGQNATTVAQLPMYHVKMDNDGTKTRLGGTSVASLLRKPNDFQTSSDFLLNMVYSLLLQGNAYVYGAGTTPRTFTSMYLLDARTTHAGYVRESDDIYYSTGGMWSQWADVTIESMVPSRRIGHLRLYTPHDPLRGVTPLANAAASLATNEAILGHSASFFNNMSRPSGFLSTEMDLSANQLKQLREAWNDQSKNMNSGGLPVLGSAMKYSTMSLSSQDAQLVEAWRMSVEDIARVFKIPRPLIGHLDDATLSNVTSLMNFWAKTGLGFLVNHVEQMLTSFFDLPSNQSVELDVESLLRGSLKERMESYGIGVTKGILAPNEIRKREGLAPVEGGDEPRVQSQMIPLSAPPAIGSPPKADDDAKAQAEADNLLRKIMERLHDD
jgi:HK97 family phage portal protein